VTSPSCTIDQRRADAMSALAAGADRLACGCGHPECAAADSAVPSATVVHVIAEERSLADDTPVQLDGEEHPRPGPDKPLREMTLAEALAPDPPTGPASTNAAVVIDRDTWEVVHKYRSDPKRFTGRSLGRKHLLSGIAYCGECHKRMGTMAKPTKSGTKRIAYQCKNMGCMRIVRDLTRTDELLIGIITERLADPKAARKLAKPTVNAKKLHDQIDTFRKLITATREEYNDGLINARDRNARIERITEKLSPLEDKLLGSHMSRDVKDLAGKPDAADRFEALPLDRRRGVIDTLTTVTIHRQTKAGGRFDPAAITVHWK
jgi:hypothetical protein